MTKLQRRHNLHFVINSNADPEITKALLGAILKLVRRVARGVAERKNAVELAKKAPSQEEMVKIVLLIIKKNGKHPDGRVDGLKMSRPEGKPNSIQIQNANTQTKVIRGNTLTTSGGTIAVVPTKGPTELHANPRITFSIEDGKIADVLSSVPEKERNVIMEILKSAPKGSTFSNNSEGRTAAQYLAGRPFYEQIQYILTGGYSKPSTTLVEGASTDIMNGFKILSERYPDLFKVEPSVTTRTTGVNAFGKSADKYKSYFNGVDGNFNLNFNTMTPEQKSAWNENVGKIYNQIIDSNNTAPQLIITKIK